MAFAKINWKPQPRELRIFGVTLLVALGLVGSLFYFALGKAGFAYFLWSFGGVSFLTAVTGTKIGMPCYLTWMSFVFVMSTIIGYSALVLIYFLVVTPLGILAKLTGRDKLNLRDQKKDVTSYWEPVTARTVASRFERQY